MSAPRIVWVVPETKGGIHSYARALWPAVRAEIERSGWSAVEPVFCDGVDGAERIAELNPALIHIQHEFGLFGRKVPPFYRFPRWLKDIRARASAARVIATAHTVLGPEYRYPTEGRGLQAPLRALANATMMPLLHRTWIDRTWGGLDAVIVHSGLQVDAVASSGCPLVREIPHLVPHARASSAPGDRTVVVFGYLSPEKGQDVALEALARLSKPTRLVLAGGLRRPEDRAYYERCGARARELGAEITGFVPDEKMGETFDRAALVLAPFRETSGSGSLAQAIARGKPVLASDLPLNREILERLPGAMELFKSGDAADCATQVEKLLADPAKLARRSEGALAYARQQSPEKIAAAHATLYREVLGK